MFFAIESTYAQYANLEENKCGTPSAGLKNSLEQLGDRWGYSYDSLLADAAIWEQSEYVTINSIGTSTVGREMLELTITDSNVSNTGKKRVYIHARTHPIEVQSFWVTNEIINLLMGTSPLGAILREKTIFHIVPMYNPDGVELELPRQNVNNIDIESNWSASTVEKEVSVLKNRFTQLMKEENPVELALNMHSAYGTVRYFVCHDENGTSAQYFNMEKYFINQIRENFQDGIQPYDHMVTWTDGTPDYYPESWWWNNYGANVMALTYEDMNSDLAGFYDKTAYAILLGTSNYLDSGYGGSLTDFETTELMMKAWPNPFENDVKIEWNDFKAFDRARVIDITGRTIKEFNLGESTNGIVIWDGNSSQGNVVSGGSYIFQLVKGTQVKSILVVKK